MSEKFISVSDDYWDNAIRHAIRSLGTGVGLYVDCLDSNRDQATVQSVLRTQAGVPADAFLSSSLAVLPARSIEFIQFNEEAVFPGYDVIFLVQEPTTRLLSRPPAGITRIAEKRDWFEFFQFSLPVLSDLSTWMDENGAICCFVQAGIVVGLGPEDALLSPKARCFSGA